MGKGVSKSIGILEGLNFNALEEKKTGTLEDKNQNNLELKKNGNEEPKIKRGYRLRESSIKKLKDMWLNMYPEGTSMEDIVDEAIRFLYDSKKQAK